MSLPSLRPGAASATIACLLFPSFTSAEQPITHVSYVDVGKSVHITGHFGQPLGKLITIRGEVLDEHHAQYRSVKFWPLDCEQFLVDRVEGKKLDQPFVIPVRFRNSPTPGTTLELRGHERAAFEGNAPEINALHTKMGIAPASWRFEVWFQVNATLEVVL